MPQDTLNLTLNSVQAVPVEPAGGYSVVTVSSGDTVYYSDHMAVSATNNQGSITAGNSQSFSSQVWLISATRSAVQVVTSTGSSIELASVSPFTSLEGSGHSYMFGDYATNSHGYLAKLGKILGLTATNRSIEGGVAVSDQQAGGNQSGNGYGKVLQDLPRSAGAAPYLPASSLYVLNFGLNDLGQVGPGNAAMIQIKSALRVMLSRIRAAGTGVFEESHASVAFGGTWGGIFAGTTGNSGAGFAYTNTANTTVSITVPADFPGGTIALGYVVAQAGAGASYSVSVDGGAAQVYDSRPTSVSIVGKANSMGAVQRLTGLTPGAHTIVVTLTAITGTNGGTFDYWQIEAPEPPTILLLTQPRVPSAAYAAYNTWPFVPNDASVTQLNVAIRQVAAEFDSKVVVVELDSLFGANNTYFAPGTPLVNLHPNDAGHSLIAAACLRAAQPGPWVPSLAAAS